MARIVATEFISLDGVMEDPGGSENSKHGAWTFEYQPEKGMAFKVEETDASEALFLGRITYEGFADSWPSREGDFADKFNSMPKYVISSTITDPTWTNSKVVGPDLVAAVKEVDAAHEGEVVVHGSAQLVQSLIENDLLDELRLMIYPVMLGSGKRLYADLADRKMWTLRESCDAGDGVLLVIYERKAADE